MRHGLIESNQLDKTLQSASCLKTFLLFFKIFYSQFQWHVGTFEEMTEHTFVLIY